MNGRIKFKVGDKVIRTSGFDTVRWVNLPDNLKELPYFTVRNEGSFTPLSTFYLTETGDDLFEVKYFSLKSEPLDYDEDDSNCI